MRSSAVLNFAQTARTLSIRRLVRVQLKTEVPGLGSAGSVVLVQPGRMRNDLLPSRKAIYQPLPTPAQLALERNKAAAVEEQIESAQAELDLQEARQALTRELGPIQLLSLRRKLEAAPTIVFARQTTTKFKPASTQSQAQKLPNPSLGIQGSITIADLVAFLREQGAFDLETDYPEENGKPAPLNRLTSAQINTACEFTLTAANNNEGAIDKLGRIKKTGRYTLVVHILPSNIRVRIPLIVRPDAASTATTTASSAAASSSTMSTPVGSRGYSTSAKPTSMESSMRTKLQAEFGPQVEIHIRNDSSKHAHHAAMAAQGGGNGETHFYVHVISDKFKGMTQIKRHRAVNALLSAEFERGLHALSLRTKTWEEENRSLPTSQDGQDAAATHTNVDDPTRCAKEEEGGSLWQAPQSRIF